METWIHLTQEEAYRSLPYALVCETHEGSRWETGKRKRLYTTYFTEAEKKKLPDLFRKAHMWTLTKGIPDKGLNMSTETYKLWFKLAAFCVDL